MKTVKPLSLGLLFRPYRRDGQDRFTIAALGFFRLGETAPRFLAEAEQWLAVTAALPKAKPIDELYAKPRGEVLLAGAAHAPGGEPVHELTVRLAIGKVDKRIRVVGDRRWYYGPWYRTTPAQPFVRMPLEDARAYGGPRHPRNPDGCGHTGNPLAGWVGSNEGAMPNLELAGQPVRGHVRALDPAGFGPLDPSRPPRLGWAGHYDEAWLLDDGQGLAPDLDPRFLQTAPADQWHDGPWRGDEAYRLENLHPEHALIEGKLPGFAARAFVRERDGGAVREAAMALDTVWLLPEAMLGVVIYHGEVPVADLDALDLDAVMVAYEPLGAPREPAHYHEVLRLRTEQASAAHNVLREDQLAPALPEAERARRAAASEARLAAKREWKRAARAEAMAEMQAELGFAVDADAMPIDPMLAEIDTLELDPEAIVAGEVDTEAFVARATALAERAQRRGEAQLAALEAERAAQPQAPADPAAERARRYARAAEPAWDLLGGDDPRLAEIDAQLDQAIAAGLLPAEGRAEVRDNVRQMPALRRKARCMAVEPTEPVPSAELAAWLGEQVRQWLLGGVPLVGRDLGGAALAGIDLRGADLREVCFERADLTGACLAGADLRGAGLGGARLDGADLAGARLDGANLSACSAVGARFDGASFGQTLAMKADFSQASFAEAQLQDALMAHATFAGARFAGAALARCMLPEARAAGSDWRGAQLNMCVLLKADLAGADFRGAKLLRCVLLDAQLDGGNWEGAALERSVALGASAAGLRAAGLRAINSGWRRVDWRGADLTEARFADCDLGEGCFETARLDAGLFARCLLHGAHLADASARGANFLQAMCRSADFRQADLREATLRQAVLDGADFYRARIEGTDFDPVARRRLAKHGRPA
ncbi:DUF2169 family type VI secretion system accessory protein [Chitinimonas koreensis]|uniref:DUF2169 family type VI secretion system accessory protein n=1 Tax=Chitinimonas koreensis TaxID=356302 RepID=UPI0004262585|nr:DUF2169 domain-containing protein [Chitinimonas koreensis]QNM95344.1 DUF2169 domain-containing protein [Chitinimonas koreensis]